MLRDEFEAIRGDYARKNRFEALGESALGPVFSSVTTCGLYRGLQRRTTWQEIL
jgi:hypothetical protein